MVVIRFFDGRTFQVNVEPERDLLIKGGPGRVEGTRVTRTGELYRAIRKENLKKFGNKCAIDNGARYSLAGRCGGKLQFHMIRGGEFLSGIRGGLQRMIAVRDNPSEFLLLCLVHHIEIQKWTDQHYPKDEASGKYLAAAAELRSQFMRFGFLERNRPKAGGSNQRFVFDPRGQPSKDVELDEEEGERTSELGRLRL